MSSLPGIVISNPNGNNDAYPAQTSINAFPTVDITHLSITQLSSGDFVLINGTTGLVPVLHSIVGTLSAEGTIQFWYDDDGLGTNRVFISGPMNLAQDGGFVISYTKDPNGTLSGPIDKYLGFTTTNGNFNGWAKISVG